MIQFFNMVLQVLTLFILSFLSTDNVSVKTNLPQRLNQGDEVVVETVIKRGAISGFVKYQLDFPDGFMATEVETRGGNFSFMENSLRIVWISFPSENEVTIKYKLSVLSSTSNGIKTLKSKMSYLDNNDKKSIVFDPIILGIATDPPPVQNTTEPISQEKINAAENTPATPVNNNSTDNSTAKNSDVVSSAEAKCSREYEPINDNEVLVKLNIENQGLKSFAKVEDMIPMGFVAKPVQVKGASFSFINQKARLLWLEMPNQNVFSASYKIVRDGSDLKNINVEGKFSYLKDGVGVENEIPMQNMEFKQGTKPASVASESNNAKQTNNSAAANNPRQGAVKTSSGSSNNSMQTSNSGIFFKVQVCALKNPSDASKVESQLKTNESLELELIDGWHKFTFGNFPSYAAAKSKRNEKAYLPTNPFVAAYNNGTRITVQEGLMISNQTWVK